jgi:hypothetical protein
MKDLFRTSPPMRHIMDKDLALGPEGWYGDIRKVYEEVIRETAWRPPLREPPTSWRCERQLTYLFVNMAFLGRTALFRVRPCPT